MSQIILRSSYADIYVEKETGNIIRIDYESMGGSNEWDDVASFDPKTLDDRGLGEMDVLYAGFTTNKGKYIPPALFSANKEHDQ